MSLRDLLNDTLESAKSGVRSFLTKPRQSLANNQVLQKAAYYTPDVARNISDFVKGTNNPVTSARSLMGEAGKIKNPIVRSTAQLGLYPVTQGSRIVQGTRDVAANIPEAVSNLGNNQKFDPALSKILVGLGETATGMFNLTPMGAGFNAAFSGGSGAVGALANKKNPVTGAIEAFANEKTPSQAIAPKLAEKYPLMSAGADILAGVLADKGLTKGKKTLEFVQKVRNINPRSWVSVDPQRPGWKIPVKNLIKYAKGEYSAGRIDDDAKAVLKFLQKNPEYAFLSEQLNKPKTRLEPGFINFGADIRSKGTGKVQLPKQKEVLPNIKGPEPSVLDTKQPVSQLEKNQIQSLSQQQGSQPYDDIITEAKKQIGSLPEEEPKSLKQTLDNIYTQWVDRYNPIVKVSQEAKKTLKAQGAELRPEYDPEYLVRRLTGAGGIADARFRRELEPIINKADELGIDKADLDIYLVNRRMTGFGKIGREVKGADPQKAGQVVSALESKYGDNIKSVAQQLYDYQNKGFQEMVDAGFISPDTAKLIRKENPDYVPFQRVMDEVDNYLGLPTRKTMQGTQPIKKLEGSEKQILSPVEEIIANTFKQRAAIEKNRVARSIVDLQKVAPNLGFAKSAESGADTITVWSNGKKEFWKVGQEIADTAKGLNEENMNTLLKIFTAPASLLRQGATGRNPEFMLPNMVRDQLDAGITSKYGYIPFVDYLRGLKSMLLDDDIYKAWENSGAKIDLGELSGRKAINQRFSEATGKGGLFKWLGDALDTAGTFSEQPTRVGLFKRAYEKTKNPLIAAMESRDATVDFARMGSKMKVANSMIPFLNVGVQGFDKLIRSVKNNPSKVALNAAIYGVLPAVTVTAYNLLNHPEEYAEIPQYEKDSNFVLVNGRNPDGTVAYVALPKGNVIPVITNPIENFMSFVAGTNKQKFSEFALQFVSSALPVIGDGQSVKEIAVKTVGSNLPQLVKPITENLVNKSFYKYDAKKEQSKEIVPFYLQEKEPYQQAYEFTPGLYKAIGAVLNVSPLQVQNAMEGYLAGYAKIPANIFESITKIKEGREVSPNEKPLLRRFFKQTYPSSSVKKEEKPSTSLMQRVLPKSEAAMATEQDIKDIKKSVKETGKQVNVGDTILFKDGETVKSVKSNIKPPELTKNNELNKKIIAEYKSDISDYVDYVMYLYKTGKITQDQAGKELDKVKAINKAISSATATKKASKAKKVNFSKIAEQTLKPVKVQTSTPRLRTQDVLEDFAKLKAKAPKIEVPEIKKGKK
jgi:hypothetical protein